MELNTRYIIDLTHAQTPADVVFELSNVIEKQEAANKRIWLKLGDINLNQSQLLSINSLINSINSTLSLIESDSQQTELAAATLGISTKDVEEELQEELSAMAPDGHTDEPSQQYIPMTEHISETAGSIESTDIENSAEQTSFETEEKENLDAINILQSEEIKDFSQADNKTDSVQLTKQTDDFSKDSDSCEKEKLSLNSSDESETCTESEINTGMEKESVHSDGSSELRNDFDKTSSEHISEDTMLSDEEKEKKEEEIQEQLDSIFDSEAKLENILSDEKELSDMKNWPLTKEAEDDFEIPEEEMTDEDYEILQMNTQYHKQTVRSGQVIKSNGNVVIIGDCHPGCEIHAAGDITVWGILGGIAHAGCKGNTKARIRALTLNAIQLRIADSYARRPDNIKNIYVEKSNSFTPEEARNVNGSIVILKINDK